jgi:hypothetical protein
VHRGAHHDARPGAAAPVTVDPGAEADHRFAVDAKHRHGDAADAVANDEWSCHRAAGSDAVDRAAAGKALSGIGLVTGSHPSGRERRRRWQRSLAG